MVKLEFVNFEAYYEALGISTEDCAQQTGSETVIIWTVGKTKEKGKGIIVFKQNCSGISPIIRLDK